MPNWVSCTLKVSGSAESMKAFYACLDKPIPDRERGEGEFSMRKFLPLPEELVDTTSPSVFYPDDNGEKKPVFKDGVIEMVVTNSAGVTEDEFKARIAELKSKYGYTDWYNWCTANWGTKWDATEPSEQYRGETEYIVAYETAWSPNIEFLDNIKDDFPELNFELDYLEGGVGFAGTYHIEDGYCWDEEKILGCIRLREVSYVNDEGETVTKYHFITKADDENGDDDYDECFETLDGNYEEVLDDNAIEPEDIENYDELVASFS